MNKAYYKTLDALGGREEALVCGPSTLVLAHPELDPNRAVQVVNSWLVLEAGLTDGALSIRLLKEFEGLLCTANLATVKTYLNKLRAHCGEIPCGVSFWINPYKASASEGYALRVSYNWKNTEALCYVASASEYCQENSGASLS